MSVKVNISIVSHLHGPLVLQSLEALASSLTCSSYKFCVWLTINQPEPELESSLAQATWPFEVRIIKNPKPQGFGANHNQAFACIDSIEKGDWFVVMNPDIFWPDQAQGFWDQLLDKDWHAMVGLLCPRQTSAKGEVQDYARQLPTPWGLLRRKIRRLLGSQPLGEANNLKASDWVNGACMVWRVPVFAALGGFDERYYLYCEDTDICLRLHLAGFTIADAPVSVVHLAQRQTSRHWRHFIWHLASLIQLWSSASFWRYVRRSRGIAEYNQRF